MSTQVTFDAEFDSTAGRVAETVTVTKVIVGGWTGRNRAAQQHHVDELSKIGVKPPARMPTFYRVGVSRLSTADEIEVIGEGSTGEVEYVLFKHRGQVWVGAGSDHTDRSVEHTGITVAKQLCDKPIATRFWLLSEVKDHWDEILLRSHIAENGADVLYQDGRASALLSPTALLECLRDDGEEMCDGTILFGGTCSAIGDVRFCRLFRFELVDPVLGRTITHSYRISPVPIKD